jgi:hypothetical protein
VRVAYALATHVERAIRVVAAERGAARRTQLRYLRHVLCISLCDLRQRAQLHAGQHHVGDGLFEEAGKLTSKAQSILKELILIPNLCH